MNFIFALLFIISTVMLLFFNPEGVLTAMLIGGEKALTLTLKLVVIYAVWMGVFKLVETSGLAEKFAKLLKPFNKLLFGNLTEKENEYVSLNISANALGMSGATTPTGISTILEFEKRPNTEYHIIMFFVINATTIQLIPTSVIGLRSAMDSNSPADIILPTIIATLTSAVIGILLVKIFVRRK